VVRAVAAVPAVPAVTAVAAVAAALAVAAPAAAQAPALPAGVPLGLDQAIATTLARDPQVALAGESVATQRAALEEARGVYDKQVAARTQLDYNVGELSSGRYRSELNRRLRLEIPPPEFDTVAQQLIDRLPVPAGQDEPGSILYPDCTQATTFFVLRDSETDAIQSVLCFDKDDNLIGILGTPGGLEELNALNLAGLFTDLSAIDERLDEFVQAQLALVADEMRVIALALRQTAASLRLQRIRLGRIPEEQENINFALGLDWQHRFQGGSAFVGTIDLQSSEDNYKGKRLSPAFGDSAIPNTFVTTLGVALELPLGRGGGRTSFGAPVRAAEQNLAAAEALWLHTASQSALAALQAYWDAAAAERRRALLEESLATQDRILAATEELVAADVVPRVELARTRSRRADVASQVAAARQAAAVARLELQKAIGLEATSVAVAPLAVDGFGDALAADPLAGLDADELVARAWQLRRDAAASNALVAANQTLVDAAKQDLRPEVSLSLNLSYNARHESFSDRFYDWEGFKKAVEDKFAGPSYGAALRFRFPVGNRSAKGRLLQAEAGATQSRISEGDLKRTISLAVRELLKTIADTRAELGSRREAVARQEETHAASLERHQAGDLSVIDTLTTEEQLTAARLQVVDAERRYLALLAQLRFETGTLLEAPAGEGATARLAPFGAPLL
jgi:outer membrane protein TolC